MTLAEHFEELRLRLKWGLFFFATATIAAFIFRTFFLDLVKQPHVWAAAKLNLPAAVFVFRYQDHFVSQMKICCAAGFILAFPFILYQALKFVFAGLFPNERKTIFSYLFPFLFLFILGVFFSYFILIPYGFYFLSLYGIQVGLQPIINFNDYVSLFMVLMLAGGLVFELPLVMVFLARIGLVTVSDFRKKRRHAILITLIVSAILTPPDPFTQLILGVPLILLYEVGLFFANFLGQRKPLNQLTLPIKSVEQG